jgi:hypothetical protein
MGSLSLEALRFRKNVGIPTASTLPPMAMMALTSVALKERTASDLLDVGAGGEGLKNGDVDASQARGVGEGEASAGGWKDHSNSFTIAICVDRTT